MIIPFFLQDYRSASPRSFVLCLSPVLRYIKMNPSSSHPLESWWLRYEHVVCCGCCSVEIVSWEWLISERMCMAMILFLVTWAYVQVNDVCPINGVTAWQWFSFCLPEHLSMPMMMFTFDLRNCPCFCLLNWASVHANDDVYLWSVHGSIFCYSNHLSMLLFLLIRPEVHASLFVNLSIYPCFSFC